jgi:glyoxylase-like metal-dependent hydrolase (beta-lactamase superfamily II)
MFSIRINITVMNIHTTHNWSRRGFLISAVTVTAGVSILPRRLFAEQESPVITLRRAAATAKITTQKLRGDISALEGSGGNIAVLTGSDGKLLVDAGITASRPGITEALNNLSSDPVKHLINTHWHFDHTDGNEWLHSVGAEITAHENTRKHLSETTRVDAWNFTFPPSPKGALPTKVFEKDLKLRFNGENLALKYYPPAHTDSDISIEFSEADILHVGDTWWNGYFPFIDYNTGGSIGGMIQATEDNIKRVSDKTIVIPGHGPIGNKSGLLEFRDMLVAVRDKVASLKQQGKSLEEVIAARPTAEFDAKWSKFVIDGKAFTQLVYAGV